MIINNFYTRFFFLLSGTISLFALAWLEATNNTMTMLFGEVSVFIPTILFFYLFYTIYELEINNLIFIYKKSLLKANKLIIKEKLNKRDKEYLARLIFTHVILIIFILVIFIIPKL